MGGADDIRLRLETGFALDRLWGETMGSPSGDTKEEALRTVITLLEGARVPYALIGGVAVQMLTAEPRTTRDIDIALRSFAEVPSEALGRAGFEHVGRFAHSDNWVAPGGGPIRERTSIQFAADEDAFTRAVERARSIDVGGLQLRLVTPDDLVLLKLAAAEEPGRRPSKRHHDIGDVIALLEEHPSIRTAVPDVELRLKRIQERSLQLGPER